ncbi:sterol desaturase family protein [Fontimonas sp. SYSU GA230001]|uniref:sterol desaturase family protein n=1 Tax=Fontimonas sp. SYSU GA230001 TaxID=3142450 RepID=UPI0032B521F9
MEALSEAYADPLFLWIPVATVLLSMVAFLAFAGPLTWLAARDPAWARRWKIQNTRGARLSEAEAEARGILVQGSRMVRLSVQQWLINNVWMFAAAIAAWPLMRLSGIHTGPLPPVWVLVLQLLFCIYLDDFLYYWMHRAMHTRWLLRHVHGRHHRVLAPWAITGHYMHPLEYVLTGSLAFLGPALLGAHVALLWIWIVFRQWEAAEGHAGYDLPWTPTHGLPGSHGALHHDFHHARVRGNYAGFLPIWDRMFGTLVRDYDRALQDWKARA